MNLTRRGFFGLLAGALGALVRKETAPTTLTFGEAWCSIDEATYAWWRKQPQIGLTDYAAFRKDMRELFDKCERPPNVLS